MMCHSVFLCFNYLFPFNADTIKCIASHYSWHIVTLIAEFQLSENVLATLKFGLHILGAAAHSHLLTGPQPHRIHVSL